MKFLIQTDKKHHVIHDFSFALIEAIKYNNWYYREKVFDYRLTDEKTYPNCIPVGSVDFVTDYLFKYYNHRPLPINIPDELFHYCFLERICTKCTKDQIPIENNFVKSLDKFKGFTNIVKEDHSMIPDGNYLVSEIVDIDSEWRAFVYKNKLVGLQNYLGDFTKFPDVQSIRAMIHAYAHAPIAYTLDVGISNRGTFVIECHDFFSCGLYGFSDYRILPQMLRDWFINHIKSLKS